MAANIDPADKGYRELLIKEWDVCENGTARYDTIVFTIRGWAITTASAIIGLGVTVHSAVLCSGAIVIVALFWFLDGLNKSFQRFFLNRSAIIQRILRDPVDPKIKDEMRPTPQIADSFYSKVDHAPLTYLERRLGRVWAEMRYGNIMSLYVGLMIACAAAAAIVVMAPDHADKGHGLEISWSL
jgi:hypothetical protein